MNQCPEERSQQMREVDLGEKIGTKGKSVCTSILAGIIGETYKVTAYNMCRTPRLKFIEDPECLFANPPLQRPNEDL